MRTHDDRARRAPSAFGREFARRGAALLVCGLLAVVCIFGLARPAPAHAVEQGTAFRAEESDGNLVYCGRWIRAASARMSAGNYAYSATSGATLSLHFRGTSVAWVGPVGPGYGQAQLVLDGQSLGTVSQYAEAQSTDSAQLWSRDGLADTPHTLTLRVLGSKETSSSGSVIVVDGLDIGSEAPSGVTPYRGRVRAEESDANLISGGYWARAGSSQMSGGRYAYSATAGASLTMHFRGTSVAWIGPVGPGYGQVQLVLDGQSLGTVSQYTPQQSQKATVWARSGLADTPHTLTLKVLGSRESSSSGNAVVVDALDAMADYPARAVAVYRNRLRVEERDSLLLFEGNWSKAAGASVSGGAYAYSATPGAQLTTYFRGTSIGVIAPLGPSYGRFEILLDGTSVGTVSQYRAVQVPQAQVWARGGLSSGNHTLTLRVLGTKVAASSGTVVVLDAFDLCADLPAIKVARLAIPRLSTRWRDYIIIDKSDFRLYFYRDGRFNSLYPVAHGKRSTPTPSAVWKIGAKYYTSPTGVYGPRKMRLFRRVNTYGNARYVYTAYGIHGTNQPWVIGTQASHGCIRLYNRDILKLFPLVRYGTMVVTRN